MSDWWNWTYFCANFRKFWKYDPCLYQFLHWIRGHLYTRRLILRPISAARPRIDLCTKNPPGKKDHCIHMLWCIFMGLGHNEPWVESHMWPQQPWGQRLSRGHDLFLTLTGMGSNLILQSHPGHARDFAWYRGQRPSPARVIKMSHNNNSRTRKCGGFVA